MERRFEIRRSEATKRCKMDSAPPRFVVTSSFIAFSVLLGLGIVAQQDKRPSPFVPSTRPAPDRPASLPATAPATGRFVNFPVPEPRTVGWVGTSIGLLESPTVRRGLKLSDMQIAKCAALAEAYSERTQIYQARRAERDLQPSLAPDLFSDFLQTELNAELKKTRTKEQFNRFL